MIRPHDEVLPTALMNGNVHAQLTTKTVYSYSSSYFTYSLPLTTGSYALFVKSENIITTKWWYIGIFSPGLWLVSFVSVLCITCSFMGLYRVKKLVCINYEDCNDEFLSPSFIFLFVLGAMSGQGFEKIPKSLSLRLIILSCLIMGMLLLGGFNSTLTSYLTRKGNLIPINNLNEVAIKRTHLLCVRNTTIAYRYFTVNESKYNLKDNWKGLVNNDCSDINSYVSKLCRPGFIYLESPEIFLPIYHTVKRKCNIVQLPGTYWNVKIAFLHARTAQHRELMNIYLLRMRSTGILTYLERKWLVKKVDTESNYLQSSSFQPVEYKHIHLSIWLFFIIVIASAFICILENIWYKWQWAKKKQNSNLILLRTRNNLNVMKARHKARSRFNWHRKLNLILLSRNTNNPELFQNVTVLINRW